MLRLAGTLLVTCFMWLGPVVGASAQTITPARSQASPLDPAFQGLSPDQDRELTEWLTAIDNWRRSVAKWYNGPAVDRFGRVVPRQPLPDSPAWLPSYCAAAAAAGVLPLDARVSRACRLLEDPRADVEGLPTGLQALRSEAEKPRKHSSFLKRVHLDGLWSTAGTGSRSYGLIGAHLTLVDVGPVQIFGPPGVLLLTIPESDGSRRITLGYTWGVSIRLTDLRLFGKRPMTLFVNVSKVWTGGGADNGVSAGHDIVGFSLAPVKNR